MMTDMFTVSGDGQVRPFGFRTADIIMDFLARPLMMTATLTGIVALLAKGIYNDRRAFMTITNYLIP